MFFKPQDIIPLSTVWAAHLGKLFPKFHLQDIWVMCDSLPWVSIFGDWATGMWHSSDRTCPLQSSCSKLRLSAYEWIMGVLPPSRDWCMVKPIAKDAAEHWQKVGRGGWLGCDPEGCVLSCSSLVTALPADLGWAIFLLHPYAALEQQWGPKPRKSA